MRYFDWSTGAYSPPFSKLTYTFDAYFSKDAIEEYGSKAACLNGVLGVAFGQRGVPGSG